MIWIHLAFLSKTVRLFPLNQMNHFCEKEGGGRREWGRIREAEGERGGEGRGTFGGKYLKPIHLQVEYAEWLQKKGKGTRAMPRRTRARLQNESKSEIHFGFQSQQRLDKPNSLIVNVIPRSECDIQCQVFSRRRWAPCASVRPGKTDSAFEKAGSVSRRGLDTCLVPRLNAVFTNRKTTILFFTDFFSYCIILQKKNRLM